MTEPVDTTSGDNQPTNEKELLLRDMKRAIIHLSSSWHYIRSAAGRTGRDKDELHDMVIWAAGRMDHSSCSNNAELIETLTEKLTA